MKFRYKSERKIISNGHEITVPDAIRDTTIKKVIDLLNKGYVLSISQKPTNSGYYYVFMHKGYETVGITRVKEGEILEFFKRLKEML
ncbi:MAG: hypothetical protein QW733_03880 [Desulfurococcaceae archaeon]